jgi:cytochrome P450
MEKERMIMSTLPPQQRFDPFRPEIHADPYPFYAELRKDDPVHWGMPFLASHDGAWYISRYDDVARLLKDSAMVKNLRSIYRRRRFHQFLKR